MAPSRSRSPPEDRSHPIRSTCAWACRRRSPPRASMCSACSARFTSCARNIRPCCSICSSSCVMGIQGMVMTRDLFNLFVFLEIVSIATYGLLALGASLAAQSAAFKFLMATIVASTFFLLGTMLISVTGMLNIDDLIANRSLIAGPIGFAALMLLLGCLLIELKPFPANGWGLDVYETAPHPVAAL